MGTGFTIDTPLRVARYGISSVLSLVDDVLIEQMRKYHCEAIGETYEEIGAKEEDSRARRITAYLDLLNRLVKRQIANLKQGSFDEDGELNRYFRMLPDSPLRKDYEAMLACTDPKDRAQRQEALRSRIVAGSIDVNIMTKVDRDNYRGGERLPAKFADAMAAFRGFAQSTLHSAIVFSAGINARLYNYISEFADFFPDEKGALRKKIVLKVSDYRSALIQGKYLAKRGLWVSEFRIESGLNCGGHAFASNGYLMGPILEEFKHGRDELLDTLHGIYVKALQKMGRKPVVDPHEMRVTVQGGIGTAAEDAFLLDYYQVDGTGWGSPFLLVPEAVRLDQEHLDKLCRATEADVFLSPSSPLGVPFWNLRNSASEENRRQRIAAGKPGSPCPKGYLSFDTEFTKQPLCTASRAYQKRKLTSLETGGPAVNQVRENVLAKSCICHDLAGSATLPLGIDPEAKPAVCCGPNIVYFKQVATLEEMVDHIYGRKSLVNVDRPHVFIKELSLYVDQLLVELEQLKMDLVPGTAKRLNEYKENLLAGVDYYQRLAEHLVEETRQRFLDDLGRLRAILEPITING